MHTLYDKKWLHVRNEYAALFLPIDKYVQVNAHSEPQQLSY